MQKTVSIWARQTICEPLLNRQLFTVVEHFPLNSEQLTLLRLTKRKTFGCVIFMRKRMRHREMKRESGGRERERERERSSRLFRSIYDFFFILFLFSNLQFLPFDGDPAHLPPWVCVVCVCVCALCCSTNSVIGWTLLNGVQKIRIAYTSWLHSFSLSRLEYACSHVESAGSSRSGSS